MSPTARINNLRQSGIPRALVHRFVPSVSPVWARQMAKLGDYTAGRVSVWPIKAQPKWPRWRGGL